MAHHLLDAELRPVSVGVFGDVYIGGGGLARDYLNRPDLTAERFVPNPFAGILDEPGSRLYRAGDRMRFLPDGRLEFGARSDQQVKIRGFRIELHEIEAALMRHPGVAEAVVVAREQAIGDRRLAAYLVAAGDPPPAAGELREFLAQQLPDYMLPASFTRLAALPLTAVGKVDRRALPAPAPEIASAGERPAATALEEVIAGIWAAVLGGGPPGVDEDFFALGGHSLLAVQLVSRLRETLRVELTVRDLFEALTVRALAARVGAALRADQGLATPPIVALDQGARSGLLPLSFAQQRLWLIQQVDPTGSGYHIPIVLAVDGELDVSALAHAFAEVEARHESLRTVLDFVEGEAWQRILPAGGEGLALRRPVATSARRQTARSDGDRGPDGDAAVRPCGVAMAAAPGAARRAPAPAPGHHPSHRQRRVVDGGAGARGRGSLRGRERGPGGDPAAAAGPVCGLRGVAAGLAVRRGPGGGDRALAPAARRGSVGAAATYGRPVCASARRTAAPARAEVRGAALDRRSSPCPAARR